MSPRKPALGFIFITLALDVLGFALLIPVSPRLVMNFLNGGNGTEEQAAPYVFALAATFYTMTFLFSPLLGLLSDKVGRRPVILIALFGSGVDYFAWALAPTLTIFFITRIINGISGASAVVANAYVADITPREKRAAAFGMMGAAFGLGFIFGPLIGGYLGDPEKVIPLLGHGNLRYPFYAAGILTLLNWLYGLFVLPESLPPERRNPINWKRANPIGALHGLGRYPLVAALAATLFLINLAQFGLHVTWVLANSYRFQWGPHEVGISLFCVGVGAAVVQGFLARVLVPKFGERNSLIFGLALGVLTFVGYGWAPHGWIVYCIIAVGSIGAIAQPAVQAMITHSVRPEEQGAVQGTLASLQSIAGIAGPIIGGSVFWYFVSDHVSTKIPGAPFYSGAIISALGLIVALWALRRYGHHADAPHAPAPPISSTTTDTTAPTAAH